MIKIFNRSNRIQNILNFHIKPKETKIIDEILFTDKAMNILESLSRLNLLNFEIISDDMQTQIPLIVEEDNSEEIKKLENKPKKKTTKKKKEEK